MSVDSKVEALNDRLAREHPIDAYYERSILPVRLIEKRRLQIIRRMAGNVDGLQLAEVGAGGGYVLREFPTAKLTAFDVSDVYIDLAKRNLAGYDVRFVKGEIDKLDVAPSSFDRVFCTEVLEHTVDPDAILATIARILKPTGIAVITVPNDPLILDIKGVIRRSPLGRILGDKVEWGADIYHIHKWRPHEFERLLEKHFQILERDASPLPLVPIRACWKCVPR